ncbi:MAG: DUF342 domain-containing protein [Nitrospinae bacterium]|nr:DUF342 domain-containing protein [Nitrospinota bacterium]
MDYELEFLTGFPDEYVSKMKFDRLEEMLVPPPHVGGKVEVGRFVEAGKAHSDGRKGLRYRLPSGAKPATVTGQGLELRPDGSLHSAYDGFLVPQEGKVTISPVCEIMGDVDARTKDVKQAAPVKVHGSVHAGFTVESGGAVEVLDMVDGGNVRAVGSVTIHGGVIGNNKSVIQSGRDIHVQFAQHCRMEAKGSVVSTGPLLECDITAGAKVVISGEAALVGGVIRAREEVAAPKVGSEGGAQTVIELGYDPFHARMINEKKNCLARMRQDLELSLKAAEHMVRQFDEFQLNSSDPMSLLMAMTDRMREGGAEGYNEQKQQSFFRLGGALLNNTYLTDATAALEQEIIASPKAAGFPGAALKVGKIAHPGVKLTILETAFSLDQEYERVKFTLHGDEVTPVWL